MARNVSQCATNNFSFSICAKEMDVNQHPNETTINRKMKDSKDIENHRVNQPLVKSNDLENQHEQQCHEKLNMSGRSLSTSTVNSSRGDVLEDKYEKSNKGLFQNLGLTENPYFSAGAGLVVLGVIASSLRQASQHGLRYVHKRLFTSIEIPSKDPSYAWVLDWLSKQEQKSLSAIMKTSKESLIIQKSTNSFESSASNGKSNILQDHSRHWKNPLSWFQPPPPHVLSVKTLIQKRENGTTETKLTMVPGIGTYFIKYCGAWIQIERTRDNKMVDLTTGSPWETITLKTLSMDRQIVHDILQESRKLALQNQVGKMIIYTSYGPEWRPFGKPRKKRPLSSVILDNDIDIKLVKDLQEFLGNEKWYTDRGIPYRRGYLLYGPPGTGKTSFIQAIAGELDYHVCVLNLSERGMTDDRLAHLLTNAPARSLILLEDIDAAFHHRNTSSSTASSSNLVTFSGLLNALDGVASAEERIIFMTTNHVDKLDPALIRPGRVDVKYLIDYASRNQIRRMFLRFYPNDENLADAFSQKVVELARKEAQGRVSPAQLQGHFVVYRSDAREALNKVDALFH